MNYTIARKLNYLTETIEKQKTIEDIIAHIRYNMSLHNFINDDSLLKLDLVFSVGGDGTMMHTISKYINSSPIYVGINAGNVGFLTPYEISDLFCFNLYKDIFNKNRRVEQRSLIKYTHNNIEYIAVNEIAINPPEINQMIDFSMQVDSLSNGQFRRSGKYRANTLLLSTPTGSTAYNMNSGGAILDPNIAAIQFTMIAPTLLGSRPIVFNGDTKIKIIANNDCYIWNDGNKSTLIQQGEEIIVETLDKKANILLPEDWNYFNFLSKKLHWNNGREV